nr:immunoglobulin light chain junction region [Macaca mulatta]MPO09727.1 immunoglobulin light chain junction region [Macaca mulatta]
GSSYADSNVLF